MRTVGFGNVFNDDAKRAELFAKLRAGKTNSELAREYNVDRGTIHYYKKKLGIHVYKKKRVKRKTRKYVSVCPCCWEETKVRSKKCEECENNKEREELKKTKFNANTPRTKYDEVSCRKLNVGKKSYEEYRNEHKRQVGK